MRTRVVIIGAGFGGVGMATQLLQAGITDLTVLESADGVGGVWRHNTYPGAGCDVPSHLYSFSFAPKPDWQRRYARQPEILRYLEETARSFGVDRFLRTGTTVDRAVWDDGDRRWHITTTDGESIDAEVLISAVGQLNQPAAPHLPGIENFDGVSFHSARWRHDVDLTNRRVGVIGTGASAIQFVPQIVSVAEQTVVFQRSAPYLIAKHDRVYSQREQQTYRDHPRLLAATRAKEYLSHEMWTPAFVRLPSLMRIGQAIATRRLRRTVADPELRRRLTPDYKFGCKRLLLTNDWYDVMQRPDVTVVDDQIVEVVADGVLTRGGGHHRVDVLVYGTGFRTSEFLVPMRVTGVRGLDLHAHWKDGASAHLGIAVAGFPNLFLIYGPQTNLSNNSIIYMLESQIRYVVQAVRAVAEGRVLSLRPDMQSRWDATMRSRSTHTIWESGCRSWYTTPDGRNVNNWPDFTFAYRRRVRRLDLADYEGILNP